MGRRNAGKSRRLDRTSVAEVTDPLQTYGWHTHFSDDGYVKIEWLKRDGTVLSHAILSGEELYDLASHLLSLYDKIEGI
jgi:hypothetical protein